MADLRSLHADLLAALAELEALTAEPRCDIERLSGIRYRLSRISGERRRVVDEQCRDFARAAPADRAAALHALRRNNMEARILSTAHIGQWTLKEAAANWSGYRQASARMRAAMCAQIRHEQLLLCPEQRQAA